MTMAINEDIKILISSIEEVQTDNTMPRNVKEKLSEVVIILNAEDAEGSLRINKALDKIEEIVDDTNLQPYTRTQIWNLASILESL